MQLYSVTMQRKKLVSVFDAAGDLVVENKVEIATVSFHDLPYHTAMMYQRQFPDSDVKISEQHISAGYTTKVEKTYSKRTRRQENPAHSADFDRDEDDDDTAAVTGDFAAAINAALTGGS